MSISKVHELIQNKGCVWTISILMILSMVVGGFVTCNAGEQANRRELAPASVVGTVGSHEITNRLVESELAKGAQMYGGLNNLPPSLMIQMQAGALRGIVGNILQLDMAKKYGIEASDADIEKLVSENVEREVASAKQQFVMQGKLKDTATEAEFAALFKKEVGKDLAEVKAELKQQNLDLLNAGPDLRLPLAAMTIGEPLMAAIKKEIKITDEDLKKTYDTFEFKRITLQKGNPEAQAQKVLNEIKGGLSFEQAMDRYDEAPPEAKKKPSERVDPIQRITLRGFDAYQPLENLKPGEVSKPITIGQSVNIFKLIKIKTELPKDFDKKKDTYRDSQLTSLAAGKLQKDLMAAQKAVKVEWKNDAYRLLYDYGRIMTENLPSTEREAAEAKLMDEAVRVASKDEPQDARIASSLAYLLLQNASEKAKSDEEKKKLNETKKKVYEVYLVDNEDPNLRIELANIYKAEKNKEKFFEQLSSAAEANLGQVDAAGQKTFNQINKLVKEGQDAKLLTAEEVKVIQDLIQKWAANKADQDKWDAEDKAARAKAAAEEKKAMDKVKTREESNKEKAAGGKK